MNTHNFAAKNMRLKEMCADEMPREKMLAKGAEALSNVELLALLLRTGRGGANVIDVAREIILSGDGRLTGIAEMSTERLCSINGIGQGKAVAIAAAFEIGKRMALEQSFSSKIQLSNPKAVFHLMNPIMRQLDHEQCWILLLNKTNMLISKEMITKGGQDATIIDSRIIIRKAIEKKAAGIILIHNHPSGNAMPSMEDINQTSHLNNALKTCSLSLIDHIIITRNGYYSFADEELTQNI